MKSFQIYSANRIIFGVGEIGQAGSLAASIGKKPFIIHSKSASLDRLTTQLQDFCTRVQNGEPNVTDVDESVSSAKTNGCDCVIGFGGGSAIDTAKATAGLLTNGGSAVDYMEVVGAGKKITKPGLPWIAIPTTAGTGAEVTRNAVIGFPEKKFKASIRSEWLLPTVAVVDPELGVNVPPQTTAYSGMDALCQLIEAFTSNGASELTDAIVKSGLPHAAKSLRPVYHDGSNLEHRTSMAYAATHSGIALTNAGLGAVHGFAAPLGANFPIPHGAICAALLPHVISTNIKALREKADESSQNVLRKYSEISQMLAGSESADTCESFCAELVSEFRIPKFSVFGVRESDVERMVQLARRSSSMRYNPIELTDKALNQILLAAI